MKLLLIKTDSKFNCDHFDNFQALAKIPTIPFQYMMDAIRWNLFNGTVAMKDANAFFWNMSINEQGIHPPDRENRRDFFDLGAKFHTSDNTPYTR